MRGGCCVTITNIYCTDEYGALSWPEWDFCHVLRLT